MSDFTYEINERTSGMSMSFTKEKKTYKIGDYINLLEKEIDRLKAERECPRDCIYLETSDLHDPCKVCARRGNRIDRYTPPANSKDKE